MSKRRIILATLTGVLVGWLISLGVLWVALEFCDDGKVFDSRWL